jgi:hypothetical protein
MVDAAIEQARPSMVKMLKDAVDGRLFDLHTAMPATIDSYDKATGFAAVKPSLKRKYYADDAAVDLPVINNVPVMFPGGGGALVTFDLQQGDEVTLIFSERSLDKWKTTGGSVDPEDPRKFHLSDAYCYPGGHSAANPPAKATITLAFGATGLKIFNATGELITTLSKLIADVNQLMTDIQSATTVTMLGHEPLVMPTFTTDLLQMTEDKATLDSFKVT